jgi:hypothetical protein
MGKYCLQAAVFFALEVYVSSFSTSLSPGLMKNSYRLRTSLNWKCFFPSKERSLLIERRTCLSHLTSTRHIKHISTRSGKGGMGEPNLVDAEKYTEKAFEALQRLPDVAQKFGQQYIEADILFYSLLQDETTQRFLSKAAGKGSFSSMMRQLAQVINWFKSPSIASEL